MNQKKKVWLLLAMLGMAMMGSASAMEVLVSGNITTSTMWTADNTYNLQDQVYVMSGATLTIEAGTVIASTPTANGSGSLAVTRGAKIFVNGTADNPVIMTSTADVATWDVDAGHPTGHDPKTGTWREAANEWGNLTIMGNALISRSYDVGNTKTPTGLNTAMMDGLTTSTAIYGGADDNDDSGSISYLSLRYGGRVVGLTNELNGLSLGGIGRATDIDHVEIMNNVDDGIEIWGGTVNLKYISIWNIGDDSFDIDQGWRGKAQFGLIVQGYSLDASQGSGVGDNIFETDGAEDSDAQPVTTAAIYNFTAIGQPVDGDHGTAWRDNARVQYRNCIWMNVGDKLVSFDNVDGDGAAGYGANGTLSWADTWITAAGTHSTVNEAAGTMPGDFNHPATLYQTQVDGMLAEISDSVFYQNLGGAAYTESDLRGVTSGGAGAGTNVVAAVQPIMSIVRGSAVTRGGKSMLPVISIDPTAAADAASSVAFAPNDGFFMPVNYRGGFSPNHNDNWLVGWSASDAFGFINVTIDPESNVPGANWSQYE